MGNIFKTLNFKTEFIPFVTFFSLIFLWDLSFNFKIHYLIFFLIFQIFFFNKFSFYKTSLILSFIFYFFLIFHSWIVSELPLREIIFSSKIIFITMLLFCVVPYKNFLINEKFTNNSLNLFCILFFLSIIASSTNIIINNEYNQFVFNDPCHWKDSIFHEVYFYKEISHLSMITPAVLIYIIYNLSLDLNWKKVLFYFPIIFLIFMNLSTTSIIGIPLSVLSFYFILKKINFKFLISSLLTIVIISLYASFTKNCSLRVIDTFAILDVHNEILEVKNNNAKVKNEIGEVRSKEQNFNKLWEQKFEIMRRGSKMTNDEKSQMAVLDDELIKLNKQKFEKLTEDVSLNLSSQVFIRSQLVAYEAIKDKIFGFGIFNYSIAMEKFKYDIPFINSVVLGLNSKDGSNNFAKLITEFGLIAFVIFGILFLSLLSDKIDLNTKIFYIPIVVTQTIRGAGYLNGGFALAVFIIILCFFLRNK